MKANKALILYILLTICLFAALLVRIRGKQEISNVAQSSIPPSEHIVHYHAGFQVYVDNKLQDFTDIKYMHIEPCSLDNHEDEDQYFEKEQIEKAHLHDSVGDVVHVHQAGAVWRDLFTNINYPLEPPVEAYVNGEPISDILNSPILANDSVVIFVGEHGNVEDKLRSAVTQKHIVEVESMSESCGS